jgi:heme-degrading monooxygenase HmoA
MKAENLISKNPPMNWNLAELNIAKMMFEPESPQMQDFNDALDTVNALADASPGFVWRLVSDSEQPENELVFNDPSWLVNLSVWEDMAALAAFIRSDLHLSVMRRRREWFEPLAEATMVLWWVPQGHTPSVAEAQKRLEALRENGSSPHAFGFSEPFPAPG